MFPIVAIQRAGGIGDPRSGTPGVQDSEFNLDVRSTEVLK